MNKATSKRAKFWQQHVEAAKSFAGTTHQYCERHKLEPSSFYHWRRRLSGETQALSRADFLPVIMSNPGQTGQSSDSSLPNAQWVAEVIVHLIRRLK